MIKKLVLRNFKSFRDGVVELGPLSFLLGANASGKSNFVDALRFVQGCARNLSLAEILSGKLEGGQLTWPGIRGGEQEIFRLNQNVKSFEIGLYWKFDGEEGKNGPNFYTLEAGVMNQSLAIINERFQANGDELLNPYLPESDSSVYPMLGIFDGNPIEATQARQEARRFLGWLRGWYFLELNTSLMRTYVSKKKTELAAQGENLSAVLFRLASQPEQRQTILGWIQELCPQEIVDFEFIETKVGDVLLAIIEPHGTTISARSMSDGTLKFLAMIVALLNAKEGSTFILEDVDSDLHPSRLHLLVSFLEQVTASRNLQVVATTHSPYLLDHLSEKTLQDVLVFHRQSETFETKATKLVDIPGFSQALEQLPLDLLHASGWMEQNL